MSFRRYVELYVIFCLIGFTLEWCYGILWSKVGTAPWIYPSSPLHYTSLKVLPIWGLGGIVIVSLYRAISERSARPLLTAAVALGIAAVMVVLLGVFS